MQKIVDVQWDSSKCSNWHAVQWHVITLSMTCHKCPLLEDFNALLLRCFWRKSASNPLLWWQLDSRQSWFGCNTIALRRMERTRTFEQCISMRFMSLKWDLIFSSAHLCCCIWPAKNLDRFCRLLWRGTLVSAIWPHVGRRTGSIWWKVWHGSKRSELERYRRESRPSPRRCMMITTYYNMSVTNATNVKTTENACKST